MWTGESAMVDSVAIPACDLDLLSTYVLQPWIFLNMQKLQFPHNPPPPPISVQKSNNFKIEAVEHNAPARFAVLLNCCI